MEEAINQIVESATNEPPQTEEGQELLQAISGLEQELRIKEEAETYNLAKDLEAKIAASIGQEVWEGFDADCQARVEWLEKHAFWLSLYMLQDYAENSDSDRDWGATESVPILTEACDQFQTRTYKIFFPQDTFVSAVPTRKNKQNRKLLEDRAKRIGDHMSYQLGVLDKSYKSSKDALFLGVALHGSFFTKTYYDAKSNRPVVENVRPTDLVINYKVGPVDIECVRRKTHIIYTTVGATQDKVREEFFVKEAVPCQLIIDDQYNTKVDETQGLSKSGNTTIKRDAEAVVLEQHCYLDLDGEGEYRPYIATIDAASKALLRLIVGYESEPDGTAKDDYKQVQYFTHYKYKNNPDGFYGLGLGHTIADLNTAVNIMLRQTMDAATLANDGNMSGFISERLGLEGDEIRLTLGKFRKIPDSIGDLTNSIMQMQFKGPDQTLIKLMEVMDARAQRLGSTTEATTGTPESVIQPTTYLAQIEQALESFSSVQIRLANALGQELEKVYRLNQKYLPLVDYYIVNEAPEMITREDYKDDMLIRPIFDPKFSTYSQKIARAQAELQATMQNPVNQGRPEVYDAAYKRYFEALDVENIEELIPPSPQIENFDDQTVENMFYLMPKESRPLFDVFPDQNHVQHLLELEQFAGQFGQGLQPDQQQDILKHKQKHEAYAYGQQQGIIPPPPPGQLPTPPMAGRPNNKMDIGAGPESIPPPPPITSSALVGIPQ